MTLLPSTHRYCEETHLNYPTEAYNHLSNKSTNLSFLKPNRYQTLVKYSYPRLTKSQLVKKPTVKVNLIDTYVMANPWSCRGHSIQSRSKYATML